MFKSHRLSSHSNPFIEPQQLDILARSTGLIRRASKHFSAAAFLLGLLKTTAGGAPQLRCIASRIGDLLHRSLSKQALAGRFSECSSAFLLGVISRLIVSGKQAPTGKILSRFNRVIIEDSSQFAFHKSMAGEFPGHGNQLGDTSGCKIDFAFDLVGHSPISTSLWPSTTQDKELGKDLLELLHAGDLLLRDMGYFDTASFGNLDGRGIHWISRLPANVHAVNEMDVSLEEILAKEKGSRIDLRMLITAKRYCVRMVAVRADQATAQSRRRELRAAAKRHGKTVPAAKLIRAGWHLLITNLTDTQITVDGICQLYGLRWRIETLFRSWKRDKQWTNVLRHITDRHHLEALVLAGIIQALLTMAILSAIGETEKNLHLSLEKFHQAIGMVLLNLKLQSPDISLPERSIPSLKLETRIRISTKDQILACLG